jgi:hypothetical protein
MERVENVGLRLSLNLFRQTRGGQIAKLYNIASAIARAR